MELFTLQTLALLIFNIGLTLGVGSSTFALIFYIRGLEDGTIDPSEKRFMHTVYVMLRVGMALIALGLLATLATGQSLPPAQYMMQWTLLAVITGNAILMQKHVIPMKIGPVLAGGSWYSLFLVTSLPFATVQYIELLAYYGGFLVIFFTVWMILKNKFTHPKKV
jgi:hypothetical protein